MRTAKLRVLIIGFAALTAASARADGPETGQTGPTGTERELGAGTSRFGFHGLFGGLRLRWSDDGTLPGHEARTEGDDTKIDDVDSTDQSTSLAGGYRGYVFLRGPTVVESPVVGEGARRDEPAPQVPIGIFFLGDAHAGLSVGQAETADPERGGESFGAFGNGLALLGSSTNAGDGCGAASALGVEGEVDVVSAWHARDERATGAFRVAPLGLLCAGRRAALLLTPYASVGGGYVGGDVLGTYSLGTDLTLMAEDGRIRLQAAREEPLGEGVGRTRFLLSTAGNITPTLALGVDGAMDFVSDRAGAVAGEGVRSHQITLMGTLVYTPGARSGR